MKSKLDIVLYVDGLPLEWDWFETAALGGSETSGLSLAKEFAKRGHKVTLFCRCEKEGVQPDGIEYRKIGTQKNSYDLFHNYISLVPSDVLILQRIPEMLNLQTACKVHILWLHDLAWYSRVEGYRKVLWNVDQVVCSSEFAANQVHSVYEGPKNLYKIIPLAVEQHYWDSPEFKKVGRRPKHLLYSSRPERGMDTLVYNIMPEIIKAVPDVRLHVSGYSLATPQMKAFYDHCYKGLAALGDNAVNHGMLKKQDLYKMMQSMDGHIYPSDFEETFCLTAIEAQRSGVPFITTKYQGALQNTLHPFANIQIDGHPKDPAYQKEFIEKTIAYLRQPESAKQTRRRQLVKWAKEYTWSKTADKWEELFEDIFAQKTRNPYTVARHFYKENDVMAARAYAEYHKDSELVEKIDTGYAFRATDEAYTDYYDNYDFDPARLKQLAKNVEGCTRVQALVDFVKSRPDEIKNVLDYGCGEGAVSYPIANISSDVQVHGFDLSPKKINIAVDSYKERSLHKNIGFDSVSMDTDAFVAERIEKHGEFEKYDCIILSEVLEHIPQPQTLIDKLEVLLRPGGFVLMTTPYGPFETEGDLYGKERRTHLHNFDRHDFRDMFSKKKDLQIGFFFAEIDKNNPNRRLAHSLVSYKKNGKKCGAVNLERKLKYVAPRETVSACIISKNNEDSIVGCIRSILPIADQIIVMDTGSTDATMDLISEHFGDRVEVHAGSNPLDHGFEAPRNEALEYVKGDWVLWIDTDEKLIKPECLHKYLRNNPFNGYSIQQHHFSCEPPNAFPPDLPVRLFRTGKNIRFYGMIHEHPEEKINEGVGMCLVVGDLHIAHPSYLSEGIRRKRFLRNFPLLEKDRAKYPHRLLGKFFWLRDLVHRVRYILEQSNNRMTPETVRLCQEAVQLTKKEFIPNFSQQHLYTEAMKYYSDACLYLRIGFEACVAMGVAKEKAVPNVNYNIRFADTEDYKVFMKHLVDGSAKTFEGKYK